MNDKNKIASIELDEHSLAAAGPDAEHERRVAIFDLLQDNYFEVEGVEPSGPYHINLSLKDQKLVFAVKNQQDIEQQFIMSLMPFKRVIKDYFQICMSYHDAIRNSSPLRIEAIDMGRRSLHNEGSELLEHRLQGKVKIDFDTARRLFTLICALHQKGGPV